MHENNNVLNAILQAVQSGNVPTKGNVPVVRQGTQILLPEGMTYREGREWLKRQEESEELVVTIHFDVPCFPTDGLIALFRAIDQIYGFTGLKGNTGFFGQQFPPDMVQIQTGIDDKGQPIFEQATVTKLQPPMFEGGFIQAHFSDEPNLHFTAQVKSKFKKQVEEIHAKMRELLQTDSIYKGKAIELDLAFLEEGEDFDPIGNAPKFLDVRGISKEDVILNPEAQRQLENNIFTLIEKTDICVASGVDLKHGCLIYGPYGTGKSLTAKVTANIAQQNGWTFIYLKTIKQLASAIQIAKLYAPAVLFAEDFDQVTSGERDEDLNTIMNTLDGIDTKATPLITVLTTNHAEKIQPGCLRPGRIDSVVNLGLPTAETAIRFLRRYMGSYLKPDTDLTMAGKEVEGYVPAFISEVVKIAKRVAINRMPKGVKSIVGAVEAQDIITAAGELKTHKEMVNRDTPPTEEQTVASAVATLSRYTAKFNVESHKVANVIQEKQLREVHERLTR